MKKVKITRGTVAAGQPVEPGAVLQLEDSEARYLVAINKAIELPGGLTTAGGGGVDEKQSLTTETAGPLVRRARASKTA